MPRNPRDTDYLIPLPNVGDFRFGRETFQDRADIRANYLSIVKSHKDSDIDLSIYAGMMAEYAVMCVEAPEGWGDLAKVEITESTEAQLFELFRLLREQQKSFRVSAA